MLRLQPHFAGALGLGLAAGLDKIRKAAGEKIPYVLVVGDKEVGSDMLAVRDRGSKVARQIPKVDFIAEVYAKVKDRN